MDDQKEPESSSHHQTDSHDDNNPQTTIETESIDQQQHHHQQIDSSESTAHQVTEGSLLAESRVLTPVDPTGQNPEGELEEDLTYKTVGSKFSSSSSSLSSSPPETLSTSISSFEEQNKRRTSSATFSSLWASFLGKVSLAEELEIESQRRRSSLPFMSGQYHPDTSSSEPEASGTLDPKVAIPKHVEVEVHRSHEGIDVRSYGRDDQSKSKVTPVKRRPEDLKITSSPSPKSSSSTAVKSIQPKRRSIPQRIMKNDVKSLSGRSNITREYLFKILVIGELATGKTSFIKRYVHQFFSDHYRATIGVDFALKVVEWDEQTLIRLQLWDIAGQERFGNMTRVYYKEAVGAFISFDVSRPATFEAVTKWKNDLDAKVSLPDGSLVPVVLLANKSDGPKEGPAKDASFLDTFCAETGISGWYYASAKDNLNIEESARFLISQILQRRKAFEADGLDGEEDDDDVLNLDYGMRDRNSENNKCSC